MSDLDTTTVISTDDRLGENSSIDHVKTSLKISNGSDPSNEENPTMKTAPPAVLDTSVPAFCEDKSSDIVEPVEDFSPRPASEQLEVVPVSKLVEQLKDVEVTADELTSKEQIEVTIDQDAIKEVAATDRMETDETTDSPTLFVDEKTTSETSHGEPPPMTINEDQEEETTTKVVTSSRGVVRRNVRRARGRRAGGGLTRARLISKRVRGGRRHPILPSSIDDKNVTLEETINTETEESPEKIKSTPELKETKSSSTSDQSSNVRVSARIKERASTGRNRPFPYTDDYINLDDLEKQTRANNVKEGTTRKSLGDRPSKSPEKRISLRQQPIDVTKSEEEKADRNLFDQMDLVPEKVRKRKSTTPTTSNKRNRPTTPQTAPTVSTRRKQTSITLKESPKLSPTVAKSTRRKTAAAAAVSEPSPKPTPKRVQKSSKAAEDAIETISSSNVDRPVRIALSSHLNFTPNHLETLRKLGFEILDESCEVDALVVDRIRRTKKFFMCLARGAHILSPTWIDAMVKEKNYIPFEKYYLEDTSAETRYGFTLRESVRLAKKGPLFANYKFFCTEETSPPYDDLKDIIEAAGGKLIEKINRNKPGKDLICIVAQTHKNHYEDLFKKNVPIVSEEFVLTGISKQKLDFDSFALFQNAKSTNQK